MTDAEVPATAPNGSILSAPPDLAVAGDPLSIVPSWRGRGGLSMSRWNRPSSPAELSAQRFPGGAEQVPPWLISGSGHAGPRPAWWPARRLSRMCRRWGPGTLPLRTAPLRRATDSRASARLRADKVAWQHWPIAQQRRLSSGRAASLPWAQHWQRSGQPCPELLMRLARWPLPRAGVSHSFLTN